MVAGSSPTQQCFQRPILPGACVPSPHQLQGGLAGPQIPDPCRCWHYQVSYLGTVVPEAAVGQKSGGCVLEPAGLAWGPAWAAQRRCPSPQHCHVRHFPPDGTGSRPGEPGHQATPGSSNTHARTGASPGPFRSLPQFPLL